MSRALLGGYAATGQGHFLVVAVKLGLDERTLEAEFAWIEGA